MNKVLRLFLKAGMPVDLILPETEARQIATYYAENKPRIVGGTTVDGVDWACDLREVAMIVVAPIPQQSIPPLSSPWGRSGR